MLDLRRRTRDIRAFVAALEEWLINTLARFGVRGERRSGNIGVWVVDPSGADKKIAFIGVRVRRWVSFHGIALNVNPALSPFEGIVPCGLRDFGITSLHQLGIQVPMSAVDTALRQEFELLFGACACGRGPLA
jgi:lipoyl(octanoyl) transferase